MHVSYIVNIQKNMCTWVPSTQTEKPAIPPWGADWCPSRDCSWVARPSVASCRAGRHSSPTCSALTRSAKSHARTASALQAKAHRWPAQHDGERELLPGRKQRLQPRHSHQTGYFWTDGELFFAFLFISGTPSIGDCVINASQWQRKDISFQYRPYNPASKTLALKYIMLQNQFNYSKKAHLQTEAEGCRNDRGRHL